MSDVEKLAAAIGQRARVLRVEHGLTLEDVAQTARLLGLKWTTARVVEFENGKKPATLSTLLVLCEALNGTEIEWQARRKVRLSDLIPEDGELELNPRYTVTAQSVRDALTGAPVRLTEPQLERDVSLALKGVAVELASATDLVPDGPDGEYLTYDLVARHGLAEHRMSKQLGLNRMELGALEASLWGRTLTQERDCRAGPEASAQKLGQVSRQLKGELIEHLARKRPGKANGND